MPAGITTKQKEETFKCSKCGEDKGANRFNKDTRHKRGFRSDCRDCERSYRISVVDRTKAYRQTDDYRKRNKKSAANHYKKYKTRVRARDAVHRALRNGTLARPDECSECGGKCRPEAHHTNGYSKDNWLKIEWLCIMCHTKRHVTP